MTFDGYALQNTLRGRRRRASANNTKRELESQMKEMLQELDEQSTSNSVSDTGEQYSTYDSETSEASPRKTVFLPDNESDRSVESDSDCESETQSEKTKSPLSRVQTEVRNFTPRTPPTPLDSPKFGIVERKEQEPETHSGSDTTSDSSDSLETIEPKSFLQLASTRKETSTTRSNIPAVKIPDSTFVNLFDRIMKKSSSSDRRASVDTELKTLLT